MNLSRQLSSIGLYHLNECRISNISGVFIEEIGPNHHREALLLFIIMMFPSAIYIGALQKVPSTAVILLFLTQNSRMFLL